MRDIEEEMTRLQRRLGLAREEVLNLGYWVAKGGLSPLMRYVNTRKDRLRGDENPKFELEQVSRDLEVLFDLGDADIQKILLQKEKEDTTL